MFSFSATFAMHISNLSQTAYLIVKFGNSICIFLNSANMLSRSVSEGNFDFDFEITIVDCIWFYSILSNNLGRSSGHHR